MTGKRRKAEALDRGLRNMFRALQARPLPDRLKSVVDQLDDGEAQELRRAGRA